MKLHHDRSIDDVQEGRKIYTVSELTRKIKAILEEKFPIIWIKGEITDFRLAASGHAYFSLKDADARIQAVMFRSAMARCTEQLRDGEAIIGLGRLSVYPLRGNYQVILEHVEPAGVGLLQLAFERLKQKLAKEGLFDASHKRPIPSFVQRLCVITSLSGAALHDILQVATKRFPPISIDIVPSDVQGNEAPAQLIYALKRAQRHGKADVIILARGGGSAQDLAAFNDEQLAREIFACSIPVVSAVGHETDFTIADLVADLRAPAPSAAAEMVVPNWQDLMQRVGELDERLQGTMLRRIDAGKRQLELVGARLIHPQRRIQDMRISLDDMVLRMQKAMEANCRQVAGRLRHSTALLSRLSPLQRLKRQKERIAQARHACGNAISLLLERKEARVKKATATLGALDPTAILSRGYSIVKKAGEEGTIVSSVEQVVQGDALDIILHRGQIAARVTGIGSLGKDT